MKGFKFQEMILIDFLHKLAIHLAVRKSFFDFCVIVTLDFAHKGLGIFPRFVVHETLVQFKSRTTDDRTQNRNNFILIFICFLHR